jgi:hypothetical protein
MIMKVFFHLVPVSAVIPYLFAGGANWQDSAQTQYFLLRGFKVFNLFQQDALAFGRFFPMLERKKQQYEKENTQRNH